MSVCHCLNCKKRSGSAFAVQARYCEIDDNQHDWIEIVCNGIGHD